MKGKKNRQCLQQFVFGGDETQEMNDEISSMLYMYLLNTDIAGLLGRYVFEELEEFLQDSDALECVFGLGTNLSHA